MFSVLDLDTGMEGCRFSIGIRNSHDKTMRLALTVEAWRESQLPDVAAKLVIYRAFIESEVDFPKHLARPVHDLYFNPQHEEFQPRTLWSLSNAFTTAFKQLDPVPQFRATGKLAPFLETASAEVSR